MSFIATRPTTEPSLADGAVLKEVWTLYRTTKRPGLDSSIVLRVASSLVGPCVPRHESPQCRNFVRINLHSLRGIELPLTDRIEPVAG